MAFKRTSAKALVSNNATRFSKAYKFSTKANFDVGKDAYILILGLLIMEHLRNREACHYNTGNNRHDEARSSRPNGNHRYY